MRIRKLSPFLRRHLFGLRRLSPFLRRHLFGLRRLSLSSGWYPLRPRRQKPDYEVLGVAKAPGRPYPDRISVGRARNCDLVVRDPSVSKLHAHFRMRENGKFDLVDLDSTAGTRINGIQLPPNKPEPVWPGDSVAFGNVGVWLLDAGALFDLMK